MSETNFEAGLEKLIDDLVHQGRFASRAEVLREGVRLVHARERKLAYFNGLIEDGLASADTGPLLDADQVFGPALARLKAETYS